MKQIIILILVVFGVTNANAQYTAAVAPLTGSKWGTKVLPYYTAGDDTATNTDIIRMGVIMNDKYDVVLKCTYTKVSGTVDGFIYVRASADGSNWQTISEGQTKTYKDSADIADATTTVTFSYNADEVNGKYLELVYSQAGTAVAAPITTLYYRKSEND